MHEFLQGNVALINVGHSMPPLLAWLPTPSWIGLQKSWSVAVWLPFDLSVSFRPWISSQLPSLQKISLDVICDHSVALACTGLLSGLLVALTLATKKLATVSLLRAGDARDREQQRRALVFIEEQSLERNDQRAIPESTLIRRMEDKIEQLTSRDELTGLFNRGHFTREIDALQKRRPAVGNPIHGVLFFNIDRLRGINDTLGYKLGDVLIQTVARRIGRHSREMDMLARMGDDEFALLLPNLHSLDQAARIAQRILAEVEESLTLGDIRFNVTMSAGLSQIESNVSVAEDILREAALGMYQAKQLGGGCCVTYDGSSRQEAFAKMQLKRQMQTALTNEEFLIYYMPLVDMRTGTVHGVEALIRWQHPVRGFLAPGEFIPLAEETGLIVDLGAWTLRRACRDYWTLQKHAAVPLLMSVNVSGRQLDQEVFLALVTETLAANHIDPHRLQLEIIENIFLGDADKIGKLFGKIRALGIKIALDDFGTGYSSLSYLAKYPIDTLKVDQSFVRRMSRGSVDADIVQLVIKLAQAIGMGVCAEGVEQPLQAAELLEYGCTMAQGFLYSRPVDLETVTRLIGDGFQVEALQARSL